MFLSTLTPIFLLCPFQVLIGPSRYWHPLFVTSWSTKKGTWKFFFFLVFDQNKGEKSNWACYPFIAHSAHVILSSELRPDHETLTQSFPSTLRACWISVESNGSFFSHYPLFLIFIWVIYQICMISSETDPQSSMLSALKYKTNALTCTWLSSHISH